MRTADFLSVYPRDLTLDQIYHGSTINEVQAAQLYSYSFGHLVFDALKLEGEKSDLPDRLAQLNEYEERVSFPELEAKLLEVPGGWDWRNEVNFHALNFHMEKMWSPLTHGEWTDPQGHQHAKNFSMNGPALDGLTYYSFRENYLRKHGAEALSDKEIEPLVSRLTGAMQETDATIAILNWTKSHPNITVVPAPAQFEHGASKANADLLAIDFENDRMVGVQVKTTVTEKIQQRYDPERIVIVGSEDLGNVRVLPAKKGKKVDIPKPWPGIIAASRVHAVNTRNNPDIGQEFIPYLLARKMEAATQLGKLRVDYREASKAIGEKILEKL